MSSSSLNVLNTLYFLYTFLTLGAGISAVNQKRLFNEICQFNPEILQAGGGSGLGLWITRGIVDLHDSTISVYSAGWFGLGHFLFVYLFVYLLFYNSYDKAVLTCNIYF